MLTEVQKRHWLNNQKYTASWYTGKIETAKPYLKHLMREAREGVVYKPAYEMYHPEIGRLFIKVRDADYLAQ